MNGVPKDPPKAPATTRSGDAATHDGAVTADTSAPSTAASEQRLQPSQPHVEKVRRDQRDLGLVRRIRRGDHAAFRALVRHYQNPIYAPVSYTHLTLPTICSV